MRAGDDLVVLEWANDALPRSCRRAGTLVTLPVFTKEKSDGDLTLPELTEDHTISKQLKGAKLFSSDRTQPLRSGRSTPGGSPNRESSRGVSVHRGSPTSANAPATWLGGAAGPICVKRRPGRPGGVDGHNRSTQDRADPPHYTLDPRREVEDKLLTGDDLLNAWERASCDS